MSIPKPPAPPTSTTEPEIFPPHSGLRLLRATVVFLVLSIFVSGVAYPLVVTGIADVINPHGAGGSLLYAKNGTVIGSSLIAQNTSAPYLFWSRPSLTDWNTTLGASTPPGPSDPALGQLINETINYTGQAWHWNFSKNGTLPYWFIAPSASDVDPDLVPQAVLIQVPRVAAATNLSITFLTNLVNAHITNPVIPFVGVPYVNVLVLDIDLLGWEGR
ncbi:MAG TPA: potassium-transporting ATPase subunit C [Thermoplasmata archaeon]|nr:potassium-transporting ATPase subunit C [Thermoplasmata archaeon]